VYDLLHIYDSGTNALMRYDFSLRHADVTLAVKATGIKEVTVGGGEVVYTEFGTFPAEPHTVKYDVGGTDALLSALDNQVAKGSTFRRVVFSTHGAPGKIYIGDEPITPGVLRRYFGSYDRLFPSVTRMYFNGCNVADGDDGWEFLETAGSVFLRSQGGEVFAWDSWGFALPWHTHHFWGSTRYVAVGPGGRINARRSK
jgi:Domain of unknown function (DUF4347)